jgi:DNA polymerase (family 10)
LDIYERYQRSDPVYVTDAHHTNHLDFMNYGVATAQKGFVTKDRVINALSREAFKDFIENNILRRLMFFVS